MRIMATDGQLPYPFGYENSGYEVSDLQATLAKAAAHGATVLILPIEANDRRTAIVKFPGGYIAEIHAAKTKSP